MQQHIRIKFSKAFFGTRSLRAPGEPSASSCQYYVLVFGLLEPICVSFTSVPVSSSFFIRAMTVLELFERNEMTKNKKQQIILKYTQNVSYTCKSGLSASMTHVLLCTH